MILIFVFYRHDPELVEFLNMYGSSSSDLKANMNTIKRTPQHVDWVFTQKYKEFKKIWVEKMLKGAVKSGGWYWHRFEWQHRGTIHVHGLIRIGDGPDTYGLAEKAIAGHEIKNNNIQPFSLEERKIIENGEAAAQELITFYDSYVCVDSSIKYSEYVSPKRAEPPRPWPMAVQVDKVEDQEIDSHDLTFCLQRHICKPGICLKNNKCKNKFPKKLSNETRLDFMRETKKDGSSGPWRVEIVGKRNNDEYIVSHNRDQLKYWRSNCDLSMLFDIRRVVSYVSKPNTHQSRR